VAYGATCSGFAGAVPFSLIGTVSSDQNAVFSGPAVASIGGTIVHQTLRGQAVVREDCSGSIKYALQVGGQPAGELNFEFNIYDEGKELRGMSIDPGYTVLCELKRMDKQGKQ
jgi:hypothetical protein